MASPALVLAARENGRKSRGPKTAEGKRKSSANSRKHGLYGNNLPFDDQCETDRLYYLEVYSECFPLSTSEAVALAHSAAEAKARQRWVWRRQHEFLCVGRRSQADPVVDLSRYCSSFYARLHRLEMRFTRQWWKARDALCKIRDRQPKTKEQTSPPSEFPIGANRCSSVARSKTTERTESHQNAEFKNDETNRIAASTSNQSGKAGNARCKIRRPEPNRNEQTASPEESLIHVHPCSSVAHFQTDETNRNPVPAAKQFVIVFHASSSAIRISHCATLPVQGKEQDTSYKIAGSVLLSASALISVIFAATHDFVPEFQFQGSSLSAWHPLGPVDWRAANGEITGTPRNPEGGWLMLDKSYQDIELYTDFKCGSPCNAGLLFRAEKTPDGGWKGVYLSLGDTQSYDLTLNAEGKEISRTKLLRATVNFARMAAGPWANGAAQVPGFARLGPTLAEQEAEATKPPAPPSAPPAGRAGFAGPPRPELKANDWNSITAIVDADMVWATLNGRRGTNTATTDRTMGFGPIALHVAGSGEVHFKDVSLHDLNHKFEPEEKVSSHFRKQELNDFFYAWGATAGDINHDGIADVIAGPFYYLGPTYTERREFTSARSYSATNNFPEGMTYFAYDYTGDGWNDIVVVDSRPVFLYVNPKGEPRRWDRFNIVPSATSEIEVFRDIDGDGRPDILFAGPSATLAYATPDPSNPTAVWKVHNISDAGLGGPHGMGVGDINGDGRMDVVNSRGWWEQPAKGTPEGPWKFHPASFGTGGAEMGVYDVNGDGLNDVVTAIAAHTWGLAWFEQKRDAQGNISFVRHDIMGDYSTKNAGGVTFSEAHGLAFADMDGDGIPDMVVGKRLYSHLESHLDPDPYGPAVLYWYRTVRNPKSEGGAEFVPELIDNRSGVGSQFVVKDLNNDGAPDVVISDVKGTFIFWNQMHRSKK